MIRRTISIHASYHFVSGKGQGMGMYLAKIVNPSFDTEMIEGICDKIKEQNAFEKVVVMSFTVLKSKRRLDIDTEFLPEIFTLLLVFVMLVILFGEPLIASLEALK